MQMPVQKILVVDDEKSLRDFLGIMLRKEGYEVVVAESGQEALRLFHQETFDLVLTDIKMPDMDGLEVLRAVKEISQEVVVLMVTAFASTETAVEAMKQGAYDYLTKPFQIDEVKLVIKKALEKKQLETDNRKLRKQLNHQISFDQIIGKSPVMEKVYEVIRKVADTRSNVLIMGESGTGKELIARAIHSSSSRREAPFVAVNCGALPEPLLESELFGHVKGAFTGAHAHKEGLFEVANNGTVFLDEIGETPSSIQVKLLRVLEEREFRRIGGTENVKVDIRIVAATNRDLEKAVSAGQFREDLYYRLDVIPIYLPSLRERVEDIPWLVEHFLRKYRSDSDRPPKRITPGCLRILQAHEWRGNVRELGNLVERVITMVPEDTIKEEDIEACLERPHSRRDWTSADFPAEGLELEAVVEELEKDLLGKALKRTGGVKQKAAELLGLNMRSLRYRLQKYQMNPSKSQASPKGDGPFDPDE